MYCFVWPSAVERLITAKYDIFHNVLGLGVIRAFWGEGPDSATSFLPSNYSIRLPSLSCSLFLFSHQHSLR
jgi:hypothetical protein